tara:strand:+ start:660 stop:1592 length:933 start_codon:yes stop_codon:yes gene_type:complete
MIDKNLKIYIAGHKGMVGSACWNYLYNSGYKNLLGRDSNELDLRNQNLVNKFISSNKPDIIINAAGKVGGILYNNNYPYEFLMYNMLIQNNLISAAHNNNIKRFIFLGSSCIYPKLSKQPIKEDYLLTDSLEPTNQWYAIAKISGIKLIESLRNQYNRDYISLMPTNLYGPNDNFDLETSHVLPALIRKFHEAKIFNKKSVVLWGTGVAMREFLHTEDLARAVVFCIENKLSDHHIYNVGYGKDISIKELADIIKNIIGYDGKIIWDTTKPDGTKRKLIDSTRINNHGWKPKYDLINGITHVYEWYKKNY